MLIEVNKIAKPGSQHAKFLPIIQHTISVLKDAKVWEKFETLSGRITPLPTDEIASAKKTLRNLLDENLPTFELAVATECSDFDRLQRVAGNELKDEWQGIIDIIKRTFEDRGYRWTKATTWQEHKLFGSGTGVEGSAEQPYKPIGVVSLEAGLEGKIRLTREAAAISRELEVFWWSFGEFYSNPSGTEGFVRIAYEPLDAKGNTIRDPRAIDTSKLGEFLKQYPLEDAIERCLIPNVVKSADYPYRRD